MRDLVGVESHDGAVKFEGFIGRPNKLNAKTMSRHVKLIARFK